MFEAEGYWGLEGVELEVATSTKFYGSYTSSVRRGLEFGLTLEDVKNLLQTKNCYYTGVVLTIPVGQGSQRDTDLTFDRLDPRKGYVRGNVVPCSFKANQLKNKIEMSTKDDFNAFNNIMTELKKAGYNGVDKYIEE